jgi:hypothetical protein
MKQISHYKILILVYLSSVSCTPKTIDNTDYEIYSKILSTFKAKTLVVEELTTPIDIRFEFKGISARMPLLEEETLLDFNKNFIITDTLRNDFNVKKKIILLSQKEIHRIFSDPNTDGWNIFYKQYPKTQGITTFSRVGYNKNKTQALIYYWTQTYGLGGGGYYVLYVRKHHKWSLKYFNLVGCS